MVKVIVGAGVLSAYIQELRERDPSAPIEVTILTGFFSHSFHGFFSGLLPKVDYQILVDKAGLEEAVPETPGYSISGVDVKEGLFHPKVICVRTQRELHLLLGSANFTNGGEKNFEAAIYLAGEEANTAWNEIQRSVKELSLVNDLGVLNRLVELERRKAQQTMEEAKRWRHQDEATAEFLASKKGVLEMATGTGKTRTAIRILNTLKDQQLILGAVITTFGTDLLDQWYRELCENTNLVIWREYGSNHDMSQFMQSPKGSILLVSKEKLPNAFVKGAPDLSRHLLVCDEVHGMGSPLAREKLGGRLSVFEYRLGLSATPERTYDEEGNQFIEHEIGPVIFRFTLEDAIRRGILCEFDYAPLSYELSDEDRDALRAAFARYQRKVQAGEPVLREDLYQELSRVVKLSKSKIPVFSKFVSSRPDSLDKSIVFVETKEYGELVQQVVIQHQPNYHTYYGEDETENLERFRANELECLITCHRLSEGIDIRHISRIVLFSVARARLETIQRIGRCLRMDPEDPSKRALVVDFIRTDAVAPGDGGSFVPADVERKEWLATLSLVRKEE
ncbi:MAG: DEAD/DEAH box helicase family protein [Nitrososphaerota archaeon]|nr:DEAD/DEAH box helicase family protein [Nitrososphaerota archaeon]MDG6949739.1 DEAD/DEAH box helicase family protein [Nitrososphaerota archaeon]